MRTFTTTTIVTPATSTPPAGPYDLTTLADVHTQLNIPTDNTNDDTFLQALITRGSLAIKQYTGVTFQIEAIQDQIWIQHDDYPYQVPGGAAPLQLSRWPVSGSITSCVVTQGLNVLQTLTEGTDFITDRQKGQLIRLNVWTNFPTNWDSAPVTVQYSAGYSTVPGDVEEAILRWIAGAYQARARDPNLKVNEQPGVGRQEWWIPSAPESHFGPEIAELIDKYRQPTIA